LATQLPFWHVWHVAQSLSAQQVPVTQVPPQQIWPVPQEVWFGAVTQVPLPLQVWHWAGSQQVLPQACEPGGQGAAVVVVVVGAAVVVVVGVTHVPFWQVWPLVHVETQAPLFEEHVWHWAALHGAARQVFPQTLAVGQHVPLRFVVPDGQAHVPPEQEPLQHCEFVLQALPRAVHGGGLALASLAPPRTDNAPASPKPKALRACRRVVVVASALASSSNRPGSLGSIVISPEITFIRGMQ
jgi:hypothetical protein